ncbi:MAG: peptidylprolyl isomerase [Vicinamibacterales bacterium]|nr:peptidylprolyl isomerase [Vicinamibacterales bacterium]
MVSALLVGAAAAQSSDDWRPLDLEHTLYLELASGRVVIELMPAMAPAHAANVKALVREGYFDGLTINRVQDNYVVQWGDAGQGDARREIKTAKRTLPAEFDVPIDPAMPFTPAPDPDVYAAATGWSQGFPVARDPESGRMWMTHCYGTLGTARGNDADSGGGTQLFVVIGHAPRHLDRNDTAFGRVVQGMELLSVLPRGTGPLGTYERADQRVRIERIRVAADVPEVERTRLEVMRTDTPAFASHVESRRTRAEEWFKYRVSRIEICNVPVPAR